MLFLLRGHSPAVPMTAARELAVGKSRLQTGQYVAQ